MATKTTASKKSTAVIPWEDQLALEAENASAALKSVKVLLLEATQLCCQRLSSRPGQS